MRWHLWVPKVSGRWRRMWKGYEQWLTARGHPAALIQTRRWQLGELSAWLERAGLTVGDLADPLVRERFAAAQRAAGHRSLVSELSLRVPVAYLREIGLVSVIELAAAGPADRFPPSQPTPGRAARASHPGRPRPGRLAYCWALLRRSVRIPVARVGYG
jgi:hypothetical protein